MTATTEHLTLVDGHVHVHDRFHPGELLSAAACNFARAATSLGCRRFTSVLALAESETTDWFSGLRNGTGRGRDGWTVESTGESCSLSLGDPAGRHRLLVMAGRQIVTEERLEVLCLASTCKIADGQPIATTVKAIAESDGIPVLPWGFGKWWGRRGRILRQLLAAPGETQVWVGDNGGRARWIPMPPMLKRSISQGCRVLSGSDPLPFPSEVRKAGSFGFAVDVECSPDRPGKDLKDALRDRGVRVVTYGEHETGLRFATNQLRMQLRKWEARR